MGVVHPYGLGQGPLFMGVRQAAGRLWRASSTSVSIERYAPPHTGPQWGGL
jgi:hypothetical protein